MIAAPAILEAMSFDIQCFIPADSSFNVQRLIAEASVRWAEADVASRGLTEVCGSTRAHSVVLSTILPLADAGLTLPPWPPALVHGDALRPLYRP